jgi:hypothetical protein
MISIFGIRLTEPPWYAGFNCPRCDSGTQVIHEQRGDRAISALFPVKRYQCSNWQCAWEGRMRQRLPTGAILVKPMARLLGVLGLVLLAAALAWVLR